MDLVLALFPVNFCHILVRARGVGLGGEGGGDERTRNPKGTQDSERKLGTEGGG